MIVEIERQFNTAQSYEKTVSAISQPSSRLDSRANTTWESGRRDRCWCEVGVRCTRVESKPRRCSIQQLEMLLLKLCGSVDILKES
jgi:hypothetical protein